MNVLFISNMYNSFIHEEIYHLLSNGVTGQLVCLKNLYSRLRNGKYQTKFSPDYMDMVVPEGNTTMIYHPGLPKNMLEQYYYYPVVWRLLSEFRQKRFDIIHAHTLFPSGWIGLKLAKKWDIPLVVTSHGSDLYRCLPKVNIVRHSRSYSRPVVKMVNSVLANAHAVIAVSEGYGRDVRARNATAKVVVIPNDYRDDLFFPIDKNAARRAIGVATDRKIVLSVGNFVKEKGHTQLLNILPSLMQKHGNILLILIGRGDLYDQYTSIISRFGLFEHVLLVKQQSRKDLVNWYNAADVFAFPSFSEAFGIALVEAMACGLPVVASDCAGPASIIQHQKDGLLYPVGKQAVLQEALETILANPNLAGRLGREAARKVKDDYSGLYHKRIALYNDLISAQPNKSSNKYR